jgi:hypothetical protein
VSRNSTPFLDAARRRSAGCRWSPARGAGRRAAVELEVLVDLALLGDGRLVERELHPVVAVGDDLAHERGVVGGDVVADELRHVHEAHDPVVELDPLVHLAELDVADDVVERLEQPLRRPLALDEARARLDVPGQVGPGVAHAVHLALDEAVPGLSVCRDRRHLDGAVLVGERPRLLGDPRTRSTGLLDAGLDVRDLEGDVDDAVTMGGVVGDERAVRGDGTLEHEHDRARLEDERLVVAHAVLGPGVGDQLHPPDALVVVRGLGGVADDEHDGVPAGDGERVLALVVVDEADELRELLGAQAGVLLGGGEVLVLLGASRRSHSPLLCPVREVMSNRPPIRWSGCPLCMR